MADIALRDGSTTTDRRLDRIKLFDERSKLFSVADLAPTTLVSHSWQIPDQLHLDQGPDGACVGFGTSHELAAYPIAVKGITNESARQLYFDAQRNDPWPGGSYPGASPVYEGTAVIEGVKAAQRVGHYSAYHWAFNTIDLARAVGHLGPVIVGSDWLTGMDAVSSTGWITATGTKRGGHCYLIKGVGGITSGVPHFTIRNSWGAGWGHGGDCFISFDEFTKLWALGAEAVIPTGRA